MTPEDLKRRTKAFAVEVVKFVRTLMADAVSAHIGHQLLKSGSAVGANYRASCRAKSKADFISKMTTVEEEADESVFWLELLVAADTVSSKSAAVLIDEGDQLVADHRRLDQHGQRIHPLTSNPQ
jgi:four helix bundle protein